MDIKGTAYEVSEETEKQAFRNWRKENPCYTVAESLVVDFPGGPVVKNLPANAGDMGSSPGPGRSHMPQSK